MLALGPSILVALSHSNHSQPCYCHAEASEIVKFRPCLGRLLEVASRVALGSYVTEVSLDKMPASTFLQYRKHNSHQHSLSCSHLEKKVTSLTEQRRAMSESEETPAQRQARIRRQKREGKINANAQDRLDKITKLSGRTPESSKSEI